MDKSCSRIGFVNKDREKKLILFDGNAILHRAYHAYPKTLMTKQGELTNAVYGFFATLLSVVREMKPSHIIVAFDEKEKTKRVIKYEFYKAQRPKVDEELVGQFGRTRDLVRAFNIPIYAKPGYEADDLLGTISRKEEEEFEEVIIVTGDKDILQLVTEKTHVYFPSRGRIPAKFYNWQKFVTDYGFEPLQMIDFKGLAGDPSDNIPGVKGIGKVTATKLIKEFGSVERVYKNIGKIKGKIGERLKEDKENALISKELATIDLGVNINFDKEQARLCNYDKDKVIKLFEEMEFRSLIRRLPSDEWELEAEEAISNKKIEKRKEKEQTENQMSLF